MEFALWRALAELVPGPGRWGDNDNRRAVARVAEASEGLAHIDGQDVTAGDALFLN
jgi:hypothetical protein